MIEALFFDLDGVLVDSESVWAEVRRAVTEEAGGRWPDGAVRDMMGMSSPEWSRYMAEELGVGRPPEQISAEVVRRVVARYDEAVPLIPGAVDAVERMAAAWPLGLASSANRELIDLVLERTALGAHLRATVSSEEVERGKPAPDVYLEAARRLGADPAESAAVEDSHNGILSAAAAGLAVVAIPNAEFPPGREALDAATWVLGSLAELDRRLLGD